MEVLLTIQKGSTHYRYDGYLFHFIIVHLSTVEIQALICDIWFDGFDPLVRVKDFRKDHSTKPAVQA